jgi:spore coat protein U-like protein
MRRFLLLLFIIGMSIFFANAVYVQASVSTTLNVNANAVAACSVSTTAVNFGDYVGENLLSNGNVQVTCAQGTQYKICLDAGDNYPGTGNRRMTDGAGSYIEYQLLTNSVQWGDTTCGDTYPGSPVSSVGTGGAQNITVNGAALGGASVPPGSYSDIVNVTVNY